MKIKTVLMLVFVVIGLTTKVAIAQDEKRNISFFGTIELGYMANLSLTSDYESFSSENWQSYGKSLRFNFGYFLNPYFSVGLGFGADRYESPDANTFPLYVDFRGYLKNQRNSPYVFFDVGNSIKFSNAQEKGFLLDAGLGYKFFVSNQVCLVGSIAYNYKNSPEWVLYLQEIAATPESYTWAYLNRHSIAFRLGIIF